MLPGHNSGISISMVHFKKELINIHIEIAALITAQLHRSTAHVTV